MGRAARECSEPRGDGSGSRRRRRRVATASRRASSRRRGRRSGLEAAADLLAGREQRVVAGAARRELHDPDRSRRDRRDSVRTRPPRRAAGGDRVFRRSHVTTGHLPRRGARGNPAARPGSALCRRNVREAAVSPGLAGPGAPVAARRDEVPWAARRLLGRRVAVPEEAPLVRAHLEEAEVLAVLGVRAEAGLAARDRERLLAVAAEDAADHASAGVAACDGREPARLRPSRERDALRPRPSPACGRGSRCGAAAAASPRPRSAGRSGASRASRGSAVPAGPSSSCSGGASAARRVVRRTGTVPSPAGPTESGRTHPSLGFSGSDLHLGDRAHGAARKRPARVSRSGHRSERCTSEAANPYKILGIAVTSVVGANNRKSPLAGARRRSGCELRDRDSNPNFRNQNPASYH